MMETLTNGKEKRGGGQADIFLFSAPPNMDHSIQHAWGYTVGRGRYTNLIT